MDHYDSCVADFWSKMGPFIDQSSHDKDDIGYSNWMWISLVDPLNTPVLDLHLSSGRHYLGWGLSPVHWTSIEQSGFAAARRGTEQGAWEKEGRIGPSLPLELECLEISRMCIKLSSVLGFFSLGAPSWPSCCISLFWMSNWPFLFLSFFSLFPIFPLYLWN